MIYFLRNPLISVICDKEKAHRMAGLCKTTLIAKEELLKNSLGYVCLIFWLCFVCASQNVYDLVFVERL